jgi:hypothetical protein
LKKISTAFLMLTVALAYAQTETATRTVAIKYTGPGTQVPFIATLPNRQQITSTNHEKAKFIAAQKANTPLEPSDVRTPMLSHTVPSKNVTEK